MTLDYTPKPPRQYHRAAPPPQNIQVHNPFIIPPEIQGPAQKQPTVEDNIRGILNRLRQQPTPADPLPPQEQKPEPEMRSVLRRG